MQGKEDVRMDRMDPNLVRVGRQLVSFPLRCSASRPGCMAYGVKATMGRRRGMEDNFCVHENLLEFGGGMEPAEDPILKVIETAGVDAPAGRHRLKIGEDADGQGVHWRTSQMLEVYHFFGCYDGHGGADAANHCSRRLHENVKSVFCDLCQPVSDSDCDSDSVMLARACMDTGGVQSDDGGAWSDVVSDDCSDVAPFVPVSNTRRKVPDIREVMVNAFRKTDDEFSRHPRAAMTGTTAVAALVGDRSLCVANCGDSKAVLYRAGEPKPLSMEHKPDRQDEMERVQKAGGKVMFWNGPRVMGVLAMSRALGDLSLRPYVIPDPDVTVVARQADDEFLILGSDGLWDVLSDADAYSVVAHSFARAATRDLNARDASRQAATALTRTALDRGSRDNITAIVVDLRCEDHTHIQT